MQAQVHVRLAAAGRVKGAVLGSLLHHDNSVATPQVAVLCRSALYGE